jgi:hypothetical protein
MPRAARHGSLFRVRNLYELPPVDESLLKKSLKDLASKTKDMHFLYIQTVLCYNKNTLMLIRIPVHQEKSEYHGSF